MQTMFFKYCLQLLVCTLLISQVSNKACGDSIIPDYVKVEVTNISFAGEDKYQIEITLQNNSSHTYVINNFERNFYAQTEVLGQWKTLSKHTVNKLSGNNIPSIPPYGKRKIVSVVKIPLNIPRLYINAYGDVNLKFKYKIHFAVNIDSTIMVNSGESAYWITPETNQWVLREGM